MTHCELGGGQGNIFFVKMIYNVVGLKEGRISFFVCFCFHKKNQTGRSMEGWKKCDLVFFLNNASSSFAVCLSDCKQAADFFI